MTTTGDFVSPFASVLEGSFAPPSSADEDERMLALALTEAESGVGRTAPNPPVGCVVAKDGTLLAKGFHAAAGEPHAEVVALDRVKGGAAHEATLYVSLEPCVHYGLTPPCTDRILDEGIARVVVGATDPNPTVNGKGIDRLRSKGVEVELAPVGALADRCRALVAPFRRTQREKRPWIVAKVAATLDGRVATHTADSRWITGEGSRGLVHALRDRVDAIVVGSGTALADDPRLNARDAALTRAPRNPLRVVIDGKLKTPPSLRAYASQRGDEVSPAALVVHGPGAAPERKAAFDAAAVTRLECGDGQNVDLATTFSELCKRGITSVLVEAGPGMLTALLSQELVDEVWWFTAPKLVGEDGVPAVWPLGVETMATALRLDGAMGRSIDGDTLVVGRPVRGTETDPAG